MTEPARLQLDALEQEAMAIAQQLGCPPSTNVYDAFHDRSLWIRHWNHGEPIEPTREQKLQHQLYVLYRRYQKLWWKVTVEEVTG